MCWHKYIVLSLRTVAVPGGNDTPTAVIHNIVATMQIASNVLQLDLQSVTDMLPNSHDDCQHPELL